jgi:hypothetical protein
MGVDFGSYKSDEVLITRICRELRKLNSPKINHPMRQQTKQRFFKGRSPNGQKIHEEMFNIRDSKGKGNKNHMKIAPHSC